MPTPSDVKSAGLPADTFASQVAVVTGAGRGIGREVARALACLGARVIIAELSPSGEETQAAINAAGGQATFVQTDVSDETSVARLAARAQELYGPATLLVNNAICIGVASVVDMPAADWDRIIAVNLRGTFLMCRAFLPGMLATGRGTIVNMVSTDAMPGLSAYIASKQGIAGFSQSLAAEVGPQGVRVIAFAPGMVDTPGIRSVAAALAPRLSLTPDQFLTLSLHAGYSGLMPPGDAAAATAFLVARLADEYQGEIVDGYTVLERAGLIGGAAPISPETKPKAPVANGDGKHTGRALALCAQLRQMLVETDAEFDRLPIVVRPLARRGFRNKAGLRSQDWIRAVEGLWATLEKAQDGVPTSAILSGFSSPSEGFSKLIAYYRDVPGETARFTRDQDLLRKIQEQMNGRIAVVQALAAELQGPARQSRLVVRLPDNRP